MEILFLETNVAWDSDHARGHYICPEASLMLRHLMLSLYILYSARTRLICCIVLTLEVRHLKSGSLNFPETFRNLRHLLALIKA